MISQVLWLHSIHIDQRSNQELDIGLHESLDESVVPIRFFDSNETLTKAALMREHILGKEHERISSN